MPGSQLLAFTGCNRPARSSRSLSAVQRICWNGTFRQQFNNEFKDVQNDEGNRTVVAVDDLTTVWFLVEGHPGLHCIAPLDPAWYLPGGSTSGLGSELDRVVGRHRQPPACLLESFRTEQLK